MTVDISHALKADDLYFEEIVKNVWLMDDHRWAYYIWEVNRAAFGDKKTAIIHVDYHWDAGDDFYTAPLEEAQFRASSLEQIQKLVTEGNWIRFDSFICPAFIRGFSDEVHFLCFQGDEPEEGVYEGTLKKYDVTQKIHRSSSDLRALNVKKPYIFDFCIDVFNRSDMMFEGDIWDAAEIDRFLDDMEQLVENASIVTVSMSYGYSGTDADTERLTRYVVNKFCSWRNRASNVS